MRRGGEAQVGGKVETKKCFRVTVCVSAKKSRCKEGARARMVESSKTPFLAKVGKQKTS